MANTFKFGTDGNWASKKEAVLAYNDENNNFKPLPFSFDRASSATVVNKQGLIETVGIDEPRIDFLNNSKGHLLLEPSRSNRLSYSEDFSSWGTSGTVNLISGIVSPKGDNSAYTVSGTGDLTMPTSLASTGTHIFSIYAKGNIGDTFRVFKSNGFSFSQNTITIDSTDWKRYQFSRDFTSTSGIIFIDNFDEGTISLWGAQLEQGSYATSYIPTQGSAVTRSAESCNNAGNSNVFNDSEGTVFLNFAADFNIHDTGLADRGISLNNGSNTNSARIFQATTLNNRIAYDLDTTSGTNQVFNTSTTFTDITDFNKVAFTYKQDEFKIFANGVQQGSTDTNGSVFSSGTLSGISFDYGATGNNPFYGKIKEVKYFNTALTDAELIALTS